MLFGRIKAGARAGPNSGDAGHAEQRQPVRAILVVEDEPLVAFDNEHALVQAGYRVAATVNDYDHATGVLDAGGIDLLVADVALHGEKTGIDLARYAATCDVPVLFVTGSCPLDARELAMGCLAKPYAPRDLVSAIEAVDALLHGRRPARIPNGLSLFPPAS
ncbi:MAG: response regulator [Sphingobium sp.]